MKNRKQGFTLVEIMIVVMIIGLLAAIALPGFAKARETSQKNACINNLRQIDSAKDQYAVETGLVAGDSCTMAAILPYLKKEPKCPVAGATYTVNNIGTNPTCSVSTHVLP